MNSTAIIHRLYEHRDWVSGKLLAAAARLTDDELRRQFPIGHGSVWKTLLHLYGADYVWLEALLGDDDPLLPGDLPAKLPGNQQAAGAVQSLDELAGKWSVLNGRWQAYLAELSDDDLDEMIAKKSTSSGQGNVFGTRVADVLLHVCTHAQYTSAQLVNMLRHLGVDALPDVMLITLARQPARG